MRCDEVAELLSDVPTGSLALDAAAAGATSSRCLRCQAELVQYRKLLRALHALRTEVLEPAPGLLSDILASLEEAGERRAVRSMLTGRRAAYVGGIAAATAAGAAGAIVIATRSTRPHRPRRLSDRRGGWPLERRLSAADEPRVRFGEAFVRRGASLPPGYRPPRRAVAQLVEHRSPKPAVGGSSPSCPASHSASRICSDTSEAKVAVMAMNRETRSGCCSVRASSTEGERTSRETARRQRAGRRPRSREEPHQPAEFVNEVRAELRKVAWPTRSETINYSIIVLVALVVMTTLIFASTASSASCAAVFNV